MFGPKIVPIDILLEFRNLTYIFFGIAVKYMVYPEEDHPHLQDNLYNLWNPSWLYNGMGMDQVVFPYKFPKLQLLLKHLALGHFQIHPQGVLILCCVLLNVLQPKKCYVVISSGKICIY